MKKYMNSTAGIEDDFIMVGYLIVLAVITALTIIVIDFLIKTEFITMALVIALFVGVSYMDRFFED